MIVAFFGVIAMALILTFQPYIEPSGSQDMNSPKSAMDMAEHFIVYKNIVSSHMFHFPDLAYGLLTDSAVEDAAPDSWSFPAYHHKARKDSNGWVYVWADVPGYFYEKVFEASENSVSVCRVIDSRQCVVATSGTARLPASLVPSYITTGSTVYAWRY